MPFFSFSTTLTTANHVFLSVYTRSPLLFFPTPTHTHTRSTYIHPHTSPTHFLIDGRGQHILQRATDTPRFSLRSHIYNPRIGNRISFIIFFFEWKFSLTIVRHLLSTHIQTLTQIKKKTQTQVYYMYVIPPNSILMLLDVF